MGVPTVAIAHGVRMGGPGPRRYDGRVGRYFTPRCLGMHATLLVLLPVFAWLTWWQLTRALAGNTLSWAYTFEWPLFAGYAVYVWWQLVHDQTAAVSRRALSSEHAGGGRDTGHNDTVHNDSGSTDTGHSDSGHSEPGWALSGGRRRNVAIAASSAAALGTVAHGERFADQTPEEADRLAAYNRYLSELSAADAESAAGNR